MSDEMLRERAGSFESTTLINTNVENLKTSYGAWRTWKPSPMMTKRVAVSGHASMKGAERALDKALPDFGYQAAKWWQWWRWGENRL